MLYKIDDLFSIDSLGNAFDRVFPPNFDFKGERHDFLEFVYVVSGSVQVTENDQVYKLGSHDLILHGPMEFHRIKSADGTCPHVLSLFMCVRGQLPKPLLDGVFHLHDPQHDSFLRCIRLAQKLQPDEVDPNSLQQAACLLTALLLELCKEVPLSDVLSQESSALLYKKLVKDMQKAVYDNFSIETLASRNFISVSYVKKLFRRYANLSPKHFYDDLWAKEAALLLQDGQSVAAVAETMNFSSPNYFTLFFKKHFGVTPSAYRRSNAV